MSYQIFNETSLGKFIELIQNKVRSTVDNATVASARSATMATQDSDGNAINTTYRKISDSYSKSEVDNKISNSPSEIVVTTDDLIKNYRVHEIIEMLNKGSTVYLKTTENDDTFFESAGFPSFSGSVLPVYMFYGEARSEMKIAWGRTFYLPKTKASFTAIVSSHVTGFEAVHDADTFQFEYSVTGANAVVSISTLVLPYTSWDSTTKTITVSASLVSDDSNVAVEVSPEESSFDDYVNAGIRASSLGYDKITFSCKTVPTKAIAVNIKSSIIFTQTGERLGTETDN